MNTPDTRGPWWAAHTWLFVAGTVAVVAGGFAAAVTGPTDWSHGSWVAAFLVLVGGVAQIAVGAGQAVLAAQTPPRRAVVTQWWSWNLAVAAVIAGTLLDTPALVAVGGVLLAVALVWSLMMVRRTTPGCRWLRTLYMTVIAAVLIGIPVGIALSFSRR